MSKAKEVFLEHQQENQNIYEEYYNELHKVAYDIGIRKKQIINFKTKENGTRNKKRNA